MKITFRNLVLTDGEILNIGIASTGKIVIGYASNSVTLTPLEASRLAESVSDLSIPGVKVAGGPSWKMTHNQDGYALEIVSRKIAMTGSDAQRFCDLLQETLADMQTACNHDWILISEKTDDEDNLIRIFKCRYCGKPASRTYCWEDSREEEE